MLNTALQQCPELSLPALPDVWAGHSKRQWEKEVRVWRKELKRRFQESGLFGKSDQAAAVLRFERGRGIPPLLCER